MPLLTRLAFRRRRSILPYPPADSTGATDGGRPQFQGYVDERSVRHVAGWVWDLDHREQRVRVEAVAGGANGEVIASEVADRRSHTLRAIEIGDAAHAFEILLPHAITAQERDRLVVRPVGGRALELSPALRAVWEPVRFVAMDIVDNCNLRCPFCLYDYAGVNRTNTMPDAVFRSALRLIPFAMEQNFWLSCLHEPTLHPRLPDFVDQISPSQNRKAFFTTNLAKRMSPDFFERLARSNLHNVNVSIESLRPDVYERMRKGARHAIFVSNLDMMVRAFADAPAPPKVRYIALVFRSNLGEVPELVRHLLAERMAWQVEVRHAYAVSHIPRSFAEAEFLPASAWGPLRDALAVYGPDRVVVIPPDQAIAPGATSSQISSEPPPAAGRAPASRLEIRMSWNGDMSIRRTQEQDRDHYGGSETDFIASSNIADVEDVEQFLVDLTTSDNPR